MKIIRSEKFKIELERIVDYISNDSVVRARKFRDELLEKVRNISFMPYRYRQNPKVNNPQVRDLIYKGYVVPFFINKERETIEILSIYKYKNPKIFK